MAHIQQSTQKSTGGKEPRIQLVTEATNKSTPSTRDCAPVQWQFMNSAFIKNSPNQQSSVCSEESDRVCRDAPDPY
jgi:hypothetical protein